MSRLSLFFVCVYLVSSAAHGTYSVQCPPMGKPRVRREWRTLSSEARQRVARAMWIMRNYTGEEGRARYGPRFVSYEELLLQHVCVFSDPRCDQGHFSPAFISFHRGLLMQMENALLAIDDGIEALPYWNMAFDSSTGRYRNDPEKYIFGKNYFGSYRGNPKENFAVTDGLFARFPIFKFDPKRHSSKAMSHLQCLQEEWIMPVRATTCRRCCGRLDCTCDPDKDEYDNFIRGYDDCSLYTTRNYEELPLMDGTRDLLFTEDDFEICTNETIIRTFAQWQNCIDMARVGCVFLNNPDVSNIPGNDNIKLKVLAYLAREPTECSMKGYYYLRDGQRREVNAHHSSVHFKVAGDLKDVATSVNDPIFFSYHADIDRSSMTWMLKTQYLEREYWKYPVDQDVPPMTNAEFSGPFNVYHVIRCAYLRDGLHPKYHPFTTPWVPGTLLNDVVNAGYPMSTLFGENCATAPYTHKDVIELSAPSNTIYTYDTLEHFYDSCEKTKVIRCKAP